MRLPGCSSFVVRPIKEPALVAISSLWIVKLPTPPLACTYTNNWNGYNESVTLNSILTDTTNNDFSPGTSSPLIDAGTSITGITDQYTNNGSAPDICTTISKITSRNTLKP